MEEVLRRARAESWSERWVREYVARRRRTREPPPRRCRRCPARDVRLCWGRGSRPPNFERRRERRERGSGSGWLRKKVRARGREISEYTCRQFRFVSCQCGGRTERGRRCMRRIIIRGGARGRSREHGHTFPMVSVERLCRWTNRFSSSWSQPWAEGCGEGAGKRRVRRRDKRPCGTPRI